MGFLTAFGPFPPLRVVRPKPTSATAHPKIPEFWTNLGGFWQL